VPNGFQPWLQAPIAHISISYFQDTKVCDFFCAFFAVAFFSEPR